jgi:hypothetical protein
MPGMLIKRLAVSIVPGKDLDRPIAAADLLVEQNESAPEAAARQCVLSC